MMWDKIDFNSALEDCKRVRDGIKSDDDFQNADSGLVMYYLNTIVQALEIATTVKRGHWSECYRDSRCISVICSVCKNPTVIAHGCRDTDEVTMDDAIEKLPHCPKCCSDMRGDADER